MKLLYVLSILCLSISSFAQAPAKKAKNKELEKQNDSLTIIHIVDTLINTPNIGKPITINNKGEYLYEDSAQVNAIVYIYLTSCNNKIYGWINGKIINGKKEGLWIKEIYTHKRKSVLVQEMNYTEGLLNGDYCVYNLKGEILTTYYDTYYRKDMKGKIKFTEGTGMYMDFFYDTGSLKETGQYEKGKKQGIWRLYDREGNIIISNYYHQGHTVTE